MKLVKQNIQHNYPDIFKILKNNLNINTISDINNQNQQYCGDINFLNIFGVTKNPENVDTLISRIIGNIACHRDEIVVYKHKVYLLVLDHSVCNGHPNSQELPQLYQNKEFMSMRIGDLIEFNQYMDHALIWDRRIDIAVFWRRYEKY